MSDLTIQKDQLSVIVHFSDGSKLKGYIFLSAFRDEHGGHQQVADLLESGKQFIPLMVEGGNVEFLNYSQILMVEGELITKDDDDMLYAALLHQEEVSVIIADTYIINGTLLSEARPDHSRLSDCLNIEEKFLKMRTEDRYLHVNKALVKKVVSR
ncbi:MAG: hypothetical protein IME96_10880 [Proteobacteria bacterium]|nr:hypothetical protein [Pseudomonadota bacterium]